MKIRDFYNFLCGFYPEGSGCDWDNDGLQYPAGNREAERALVSLDPSYEAFRYAAENNFSLLLTHHPLIFNPIGDLCSDKLDFIVKNNIAAISLHTRLDAGAGGVNDILASKLDLHDTSAFGEGNMGRIGLLGRPLSSEEFAAYIKEKIGAPHVEYRSDKNRIEKAALLGGAGADNLYEAEDAGADAFVTGEVKHNVFVDAAGCSCALFVAGHYFTEFPVCARLAELCEDAGIESEIFAEAPFKTI